MRLHVRMRATRNKEKVAAMFDEEYAVISAPEDSRGGTPSAVAPDPDLRTSEAAPQTGRALADEPADISRPSEPPRTPYRPWKRTSAKDIKRSYALTLEVGFVAALALLLGLVQIDYQPSGSYDVALTEQEVVTMQEVVQTQQEQRPPAPPRPAPPIVVPDSRVVPDEPLNFDAKLDLNESLNVSAAPPPSPPEPDPQPERAETEIFVVVEEMPVLIGGMASISEHLNYPEVAIRAQIEGRVIVRFVIDETGAVTQPEIVQGQHKLLDEEALRVVQQLRFTPGRQRGKPVKVQMAIPITFALKMKK